MRRSWLQKESDPFLRDNYLAIAKVNGELCEHEPRTFREAVQFLAHFQAVDRTFYAGGALGGAGYASGRIF